MNSIIPGDLQGQNKKEFEKQKFGVRAEKRQNFNPEAASQLILGLFFGMIFGFLLQKGGVAKYEVLLGALFLTDFTVMKIMLTAIATGMVGIFSMHALGLIELHIKPTRYMANIVGGLIFGVGFGLLGYCPGTGAAALGQGNYDAIAGILGLLAGSYLYAEMSGHIQSNALMKWGNRGNLLLSDVVGMSRRGFIFSFVFFLAVILYFIEVFSPVSG